MFATQPRPAKLESVRLNSETPARIPAELVGTLVLLHRDLAYGGVVVPAPRARELAEGFVGLFGPEECRFATNWPLRGGRFASAWNPATSFTFDAGVVVVGQERAGVLWVADED